MDILPQLLVNGVVVASLYALIAIGFSLIYGTAKFFNLAHGVMALIGAYAVIFLNHSTQLPVYLSIPVGIIVAGSAGYITDKLIYAPMRRHRASSMVLLVASLGVLSVIQASIALIFGSQFQTLSSNLSSAKIYSFGLVTVTQVQLVAISLLIVVIAGLMVVLKKTNFGKAVRAISDDEEVAKIVGINTSKITGYVFFISSAIAGLAGILIGFDTGVLPSMGLFILLKGVIAAIIGGVGNVVGAVIGAFVLGLAENLGIWKISAEWKDAIAFIVLIIFLVFRPQGIMNK